MKVTHQEVRMPQTLEQPPRTVHRDTYTFAVALPAVEQYLPFGNMESRNGLQERIEIPLLVRALRLPRGRRVLEVGCGRGLALPVLADRLRPDALVGVDADRSLVGEARRRVVRPGPRAGVHLPAEPARPVASAGFD